MALRAAGFKWYDGFFLSMLLFSIIMVMLSWQRYHQCKLPLHLWIAVDYGAIFVFRLLMFVDNWIVSQVRLDYGRQLRGGRLYGRLAVISILYAVLYPFLWAWSVIGAVWFTGARNCLPEKNQKWGFLVWLFFSFCGLICLAGNFGKKWLARRRAHVRRAPQGTRVSEFMVLRNMIRQPDSVYEVAAHETRAFDQDNNPYNTGMNTETQRAAVETAIQQLPVFALKGVPTDCSDCPICLEEFVVGQEVRGLPCAHNFHVACIDTWLRLNTKCPRCRCLVFPSLNVNNPSTISVDHPDHSSVLTTQHMISQPSNSTYLTRMQSFLVPVQADSVLPSDSSLSPSHTSSNEPCTAMEIVEDGGERSEPIQ